MRREIVTLSCGLPLLVVGRGGVERFVANPRHVLLAILAVGLYVILSRRPRVATPAAPTASRAALGERDLARIVIALGEWGRALALALRGRSTTR